MTHHTRQSALGLPFIVHEEFEGTGVRGLRVHHERDHRLGVRLHEEERGQARHPVPRRDQLRVRDALSLHAAVLAVQDVRAPCGARGVDHRLRRQPARVQQVGARVRHRHARPREEDQRRARLRGVEGLRRVEGHASGHPHVPRDQEEPLLLHRGVARRQVVRHGARLGRPVGHDGRVRAAGQGGGLRPGRAVRAERGDCARVRGVLRPVQQVPRRLPHRRDPCRGRRCRYNRAGDRGGVRRAPVARRASAGRRVRRRGRHRGARPTCSWRCATTCGA